MGSDNQYEHQSEWRDNLSYWRDYWAAEREKSTLTGSATLNIPLYKRVVGISGIEVDLFIDKESNDKQTKNK